MKGCFIILVIERRQKIIEIIKRDHKVYVTNLSELFNVSEETIRRDLTILENDSLLKRTYGGAVATEQTKEDPSFSTRNAMNLSAKQSIASKACKLISDNATIMLDSSTTSLELVHTLVEKKNLTIITSSVKILSEFTSYGLNIICTGGTLRSHSFSLIGSVAQNTVSKYHVDLTVISCKSLSLESGIMDSNEAECDLKKAMVKQAAKTILLADHSKFDQVSFIKIVDFSDIDYIITDEEPSAEWLEVFKKYNIELIY